MTSLRSTLSELLTNISVCAVCPAGGTTDVSAKVFGFSGSMSDISAHFRMNNKSFYLSIFGYLQLLYVLQEHLRYLGRLLYSILVECTGRVKLKFCGVVSAARLLSVSAQVH